MRACLVVAALLYGGVASAQERSEEELFGKESDEKAKEPQKPPGAPPDARDGEDQDGKRLMETFVPKDILSDKLQIGGLVYMQLGWSFTDGDSLVDHPLSSPNFVDLYLDANPTDRLRAFVRGRLKYDPTIDTAVTSPILAATGSTPKQVDVLLDEFWLKFDVGRAMFVTLGQQKVKYGATRIWNPVDVINATRRDPFAPFDSRPGVPMLKLHFPVESLGWNFYLLGLLDKVTSLDRAGAAGRVEMPWSCDTCKTDFTGEAGVVGAYRKLETGHFGKLGVDLSMAIWDIDLMSEVGLTFDDASTPTVQVSSAVSYTWKYSEKDSMTFGLEYLYNEVGFQGGDGQALAALVNRKAQSLYLGQHYVGGFLLLPRPGNADLWTFTLTGIGNLSDHSGMIRFDASVQALTYLSVQLYVAGHLGDQGELRFGPESFGPPDKLPAPLNVLFPTFIKNTQVLDVGLYLRLDI